MDKKNVLLVGGTSFIAKKFIETNKDVFNIHSISRKPNQLENNFIINNFFELPDTKFEDIDVVINFAAIVHKPNYKNREVYKKINFELPLFLAKMAKNNNCSHFIQISTIAVYGDAEIINDKTPYDPINNYGLYKQLTDIELLKLSSSNFSITCLRPSMVYGSYGAPGNMQSLINLAKLNLPLPFKGINNSRQFLNVYNLTNALKCIIKKKLNGIIILADEDIVSTSTLFDKIIIELRIKNRNFKLDVFWKLLSIVKPKITRKLVGNLKIDNTYSYKELGIYYPKSFEDGIREMISNHNI